MFRFILGGIVGMVGAGAAPSFWKGSMSATGKGMGEVLEVLREAIHNLLVSAGWTTTLLRELRGGHKSWWAPRSSFSPPHHRGRWPRAWHQDRPDPSLVGLGLTAVCLVASLARAGEAPRGGCWAAGCSRPMRAVPSLQRVGYRRLMCKQLSFLLRPMIPKA